MDPIRGHPVRALNGTQGHNLLISSLVAHYTHRLDRKQDRPCLPNFVVQARITQSLDKDVIPLYGDFFICIFV